MVALPAATPVTSPVELTVAIEALLVFQVTVLLVAFDGNTAAVSCCVPPTLIDVVVGLTDTPVTGTLAVDTVTALVAVKPPSWVVTVMVALPAATAVTSPEEFTVATEVLPDVQLTVLFVALEGATVAVSCCVPPGLSDTVTGDTDTPVTGILPVPLLTLTFVILDVHNVPSLWEVTHNPT